MTGPTGIVPVAVGIPSSVNDWDGVVYNLNSRGIGAAVVGGITNGGTLGTAVIDNFTQGEANGMITLTALTGNTHPYYTSDASFTAHLDAVATQLSGLNTYFAARNEPLGGGFSTTQIINEITAMRTRVRLTIPGALFIGPTDLLLGGTLGRTTYMPAYIAGGILSAVDIFAWHDYGNGSPEFKYQQEMCYVINRVLAVNPNMPMAMSESGWQHGNSGANEYAPDATKAAYLCRMIWLCRSIPNQVFTGIYKLRNDDESSGAFGVSNTTACTNGFTHACAEMLLWTSCASYTRPSFNTTSHQSGAWAASEDLIGGNLGSAPWFVRGTTAGGGQRLTMWHASSSSYAETIYVNALSPGTLTILTDITTSDGTPTTVTLIGGVQAVPVTLGAAPFVAYSDNATILFPEFSH